MKLGMISLGCSKNKIDTELFLGVAKKYGIEITNKKSDADILVVNTCGFIEPAKKEAIDTILELTDYKDKIIIAMGCLVERYLDDLKLEIPEVDYYLPIRDYEHIEQIFRDITKQNLPINFYDYTNRVLTSSKYSAYIRIAEGCDNRCSYCAIPLIRGNFVSRKYESIMEEARFLINNGAKEITLIAQDTTKYGTDLSEGKRLNNLLHDISLIKGVEFVRVLYLYPDEITPEIYDEIKNNDKVCSYFDIPLQHASNKILKLMNRRGTKEEIINLINKIKSEIPSAIIRTTLITGFPGETNEDFLELLEFIKVIEFDKMGVFTYSDEEDTKGYLMLSKVPQNIMDSRLEKLMTLQQTILEKKMKKFIGNTYKTIIDNYDEVDKVYYGRNYCFAPDDVDGRIYITSFKKLSIGQIYDCLITNSDVYDLFGEIK